ncbi:g7764 [Coccomyxa elongata]
MVSVTVTNKGRKYTVKIDAADYKKYVKGKLLGILYTQGHAYARVGNSNQLLHRLIKGASGKLVVHHKNGNRLDNRRSNLELTTQAHNVAEGTSGTAEGTLGSEINSGRSINLLERHILDVLEDEEFSGRFQHLLYDSWRGENWHAAKDISTFLLRAASPDPAASRSAYDKVAGQDEVEDFMIHVVDWALDNMLTGSYAGGNNLPLDQFICLLRLVQPDIPYLPDVDEYRTYFLKGPEWQGAVRMEDEARRTVVCNRIVHEAILRIRSLQTLIAHALKEHQDVLDTAKRIDRGVHAANKELQRRRAYRPRCCDVLAQGARLFCDPFYLRKVFKHVGTMISDVINEMMPYCGPEIDVECQLLLHRHDVRVRWFAEMQEERKTIEYLVEVIELD